MRRLTLSSSSAEVADFNANVLHDVGRRHHGSLSQQSPVPLCKPVHSERPRHLGEVLREAHARNIRMVSRWDFSKAHKDAFDAHPDWFFKMADGQPAIYNGLYQACINGGWYRQKVERFLPKRSIATTSTAASSTISTIRQPTTASASSAFATATTAKRLFRERFQRDVPDYPRR